MKDIKPGETATSRSTSRRTTPRRHRARRSTGDALGTNTNLGNLIDDNEATNDGPDRRPGAGRWVVVDARHDEARDHQAVGVSALLVPATTASRRCAPSTLYGCTAGKPENPTCDGSIAAGWKRIVTRADDAFPSRQPAARHAGQTLRYFDADGAPPATHVKFVVATNQCTGQPSYQGDQDLDPDNNADCRPSPRASEVHATELQVFGYAEGARRDGKVG